MNSKLFIFPWKGGILMFGLMLFTCFVMGQTSEGVVSKMNSPLSQKIYFTKSYQQLPDQGLFINTYKLQNASGKPMLMIKSINHKRDRKITIAFLDMDSTEINEFDIPYRDSSGIILADGTDSLTKFNLNHKYSYLLSFDDTARMNVNIHQIQSGFEQDASHYQLDSLSAFMQTVQQHLMDYIHFLRKQAHNSYLQKVQQQQQQQVIQDMTIHEQRLKQFMLYRETAFKKPTDEEMKKAESRMNPKLFDVANRFTGHIIKYNGALTITTDTDGYIRQITEKEGGPKDTTNSQVMLHSIIDTLMGLKLPKVYEEFDSAYYTMRQQFDFTVNMKDDVKMNRWKLLSDALIYPKVSYYENKEMDDEFFKAIKHNRRGLYEFMVYHNEVQGLSANAISRLVQKSGEIHYFSISDGLDPLVINSGGGSGLGNALLKRSTSLTTITMSYFSRFGGFISFNYGDHNSLQKQFGFVPPRIFGGDTIANLSGKLPKGSQDSPIGDLYATRPAYFEIGGTMRIYHPLYLRLGIAHISRTPIYTWWEDVSKDKNGNNTYAYINYLEQMSPNSTIPDGTNTKKYFFSTNKNLDSYTFPVAGFALVFKYFQCEFGFNGVFFQPYFQFGVNYPFADLHGFMKKK